MASLPKGLYIIQFFNARNNILHQVSNNLPPPWKKSPKTREGAIAPSHSLLNGPLGWYWPAVRLYRDGAAPYPARLVVGIEYNPELILDLPGPLFMGLGLVAHYSFDAISAFSAYGEFEVFNDYTTYYGALVQRFGKLGVSMRVGFEK